MLLRIQNINELTAFDLDYENYSLQHATTSGTVFNRFLISRLSVRRQHPWWRYPVAIVMVQTNVRSLEYNCLHDPWGRTYNSQVGSHSTRLAVNSTFTLWSGTSTNDYPFCWPVRCEGSRSRHWIRLAIQNLYILVIQNYRLFFPFTWTPSAKSA